MTEEISKNTDLIEELREERSAVWALYCKLAGMTPLANIASVKPLLSEFSQLLIDYVSLGHFGVYEHLLNDKKDQTSTLSIANQIYPKFSSTTASAVDFTDVYDGKNKSFNIENFVSDLSKLGENLADRMELEDQLCSMLLS